MDPAPLALGFLGAWQEHRPQASWRRALEARTAHVFRARSGRKARRLIAAHLAAIHPAAGARVEVRLAGYSWGAWTAVQVAAWAWRTHHATSGLDLQLRLGLLDPVGVFRGRAPLPRDPAVQAWVIHQRNGCARGCPGPSRWYRGVPIPGAVWNRDVTEAGRALAPRDGVPAALAPDHIQVGYTGFGGYDVALADVLRDGHVVFPGEDALPGDPAPAATPGRPPR